MRINVGIDVGKESLDLCILLDKTTGRKRSKKFENKKDGFCSVYKWIEKSAGNAPKNVLITIEATGVYHEAVAYFLHGKGFKIFLSNPGKAKKFAQSLGLLHKTDKSDAAMLARYGSMQLDDLTLWMPEDNDVRAIKALIRRLSALEKDRLRESNRLEASVISDAATRVIKSTEYIISILDNEINEIQNEIDNLITSNQEMSSNRELLLSVVGIGKVMARELVYLFAAKKFSSAKQVAAYVGLIPRLNESGTFKERTTLSKSGPSRIRSKLFLAAVCAGTHNPDIKAQKARLIGAGKKKMQALGAAMRKLIQICFGVIKNQTRYTPQIVLT
ncbi:MAG: IS110 family transposase [Pseudomonadales bacterium]